MLYTLDTACNTNETGNVFPQIQKMSKGYNYSSNDSVYSISESTNSFPLTNPNLDSFILSDKSKLTDLLSNSLTGNQGFLVSEKLKTIFERFEIAPHRFYPAQIYQKGTKIEKYYWMHIICDLTSFISYEKSIFFIYKDYSIDLGNINIKTKEEFIEKKKILKEANPGHTVTIWSKKICFNKDYKIKYDLFSIGLFDSSFYISEELKKEILNNKISGCDIKISKKLE